MQNACMAPSRRGGRLAYEELVRAAAFRAELRRFLRKTVEVTSQFGLTAERYDLLLMIRTAENESGIPLTALCDRLHLRQTAVTELVKRAVTAGLVERRASPEDRRVRLLRLTPEGERRLSETFNALREDRRSLAEVFHDLDQSFHDANA